MDPNRNRAPRWLTLVCLAAIALFAVFAGHDNPPRDRGNAPNLGVIAPASPEAPSALTTTAVGTPLHAPRAAKTVRPSRPRATPPASTTGAGRVIAIDPETGQPGAPSPEQMRALGVAPGSTIESLTAEGLVETRLPNGTVILHLDERFHDYLIARVGRDGRVTYGCIYDHGGPERALRDTTAAPALEVE